MPLLPPQRWQPLRRLRQKTSLTQVVIIALDPDPEAAACNGRELYLVSLSHPKTTHSSCGQVSGFAVGSIGVCFDLKYFYNAAYF